jgi:UDP-glucose 4-epimerase
MNLSGKRTLVTGGTGFIGSYVTRQLTDHGADVHALDNGFTGSEDLVPESVMIHDADIRDAEATIDIITSVDPTILIHLAAIHFVPYCNNHPEKAFDVNVLGTRNVLNATRELTNLQCVVNASSAAVYQPASGPHQEDEGIEPTDIYGRTKLVAEDEARLFNIDTGIPTPSARLFNVYGTRETNAHLIPAILEQIKAGSRSVDLGNLTPARDFIHASDAADAIITLATRFDGDHRAYNIGTGTEHTVQEVVEAVGEVLGETIEIKQDEERVRESDRPHLEPDVSRMDDEFGWSASLTLTEGLERLLKSEDII